MHIVILAEFASASGGAEKVAVESARGLADLGLDVTYIQAVDGPADPLLDHPRLSLVRLGLSDVWSLPVLAAAAAGIWHGEAARRLAGALAAVETPADCIHVHQWTRSLSPSVFPLLFDLGVPVLLTAHDYFLACPNGVHYRYDRAEPCALKPMSASCLASPCDARSRAHKLVRVARSAAMRAAIAKRRLDVVHVCDASVARLSGMLPGYDLHHHRIDNPVRTERAAPADPGKGCAIAYVGRLTREKGADLVAQAARRAGMPALFIGTGPLEEELAGRPGVEMLGWRSPAEVEAILRGRARALAAPSRWFETGPLTVYEALAAGIPVVASERSGAAGTVADGATGFVVAPEVEPLAAAFRRLGDPTLAAAMGREAHARYWAAPMSLGRHAASLQALYRGLIPAPLSAPQHRDTRPAAAELLPRPG